MKSNLILLLTAFIISGFPTFTFSQSLTLTSPIVSKDIPAGDDYFTDVISQPADGKQKRMIGWEGELENRNFSNENGIWKGFKKDKPFSIFPVFPSIKGALLADSLPEDKTLPKFGTRYPVDASKYTKLSYFLNVGNRSTSVIHWNNDWNDSDWWPTGSTPKFGFLDTARKYKGHQGWYTYDIDLKKETQDRIKEYRWGGQVYGVRLDPSILSQGGSLEIDWMRLVDPRSAPDITISWEHAGFKINDVVTICYVHKLNSNQCKPLKKFQFWDKDIEDSYTFSSAILPPGKYYFYLEVNKYDSLNRLITDHIARSNYSAEITIHKNPEVIITAPAPDSGESYSMKIRGKEWDMQPEGNDVRNLRHNWSQVWRQFLNHSFGENENSDVSGYVFQALAEPPYFHLGNAESDVQVHLDIPDNNPIDPNYYRYFVYKMAIGEDGYPDLHSKISQGWVSRVVAWNNGLTDDDKTETKAHLVYDGWNTYWFDLADDNNRESGIPWISQPFVKNLRLDPGEFNIPGFHTWFFLDYVKLYSENRPVNDEYEIAFTIKDETEANYTVDIYYDQDRFSFDGTHIAKLEGLRAGEHVYKWNTSELPGNKEYYIYLLVKDGNQETKVYSTVHLKTSRKAGERAFSWDYSGDGADDYTVYRPSTGMWYNRMHNGSQAASIFGNFSHTPIRGDFDGDGKIDKGLMVDVGGTYFYYIVLSSTGQLFSTSWGRTGDVFVIADYNNNGKDQIAVWRPSDGNWYVLDEKNGAYVYQWGLPGDIPVPADYTGDGKINLAIWRPSTGNWWIRHSTESNSSYSVQQWGLPGDIPVQGFQGDERKSKYLVWRPTDGTWYLKDPEKDEIKIRQWGLPGDIPLLSDHNNDGVLDFSVFRNGFWYHHHGNAGTSQTGWGLPGDKLPAKVGLPG